MKVLIELEFIDVPKEHVKFFKKNEDGNWKVTEPENYEEINNDQMNILKSFMKK